MSKTEQTTAKTAAKEQNEPEKLTLTEFCMRLSVSVRRPELLNAFNHRMQAAGVTKDTEASFAAKFDAFRNTPV